MHFREHSSQDRRRDVSLFRRGRTYRSFGLPATLRLILRPGEQTRAKVGGWGWRKRNVCGIGGVRKKPKRCGICRTSRLSCAQDLSQADEVLNPAAANLSGSIKGTGHLLNVFLRSDSIFILKIPGLDKRLIRMLPDDVSLWSLGPEPCPFCCKALGNECAYGSGGVLSVLLAGETPLRSLYLRESRTLDPNVTGKPDKMATRTTARSPKIESRIRLIGARMRTDLRWLVLRFDWFLCAEHLGQSGQSRDELKFSGTARADQVEIL
uniref:Uncharacterized protein n=1 Tax=Timema bartmani TaxID=61472 RepID=A0A7R9I1M2_9NEOP|nr:unnamed protein product [Timema bartmani]